MGRKKEAKRDKIGLVAVLRTSAKVFGPVSVSIQAPFQQFCGTELEILELLKTEERTKAATHGLLTFKQIRADNLTGSISRNYPLKRPSKLQLNPKKQICKQTTSPAALTLHSCPSLARQLVPVCRLFIPYVTLEEFLKSRSRILQIPQERLATIYGRAGARLRASCHHQTRWFLEIWYQSGQISCRCPRGKRA